MTPAQRYPLQDRYISTNIPFAANDDPRRMGEMDTGANRGMRINIAPKPHRREIPGDASQEKPGLGDPPNRLLKTETKGKLKARAKKDQTGVGTKP